MSIHREIKRAQKDLEEEVRGACSTWGPDKASGLDELSIKFFLTYQDITKVDLMIVFEEFYLNGVITKGINYFYFLDPKNENCELNFSGIQLCTMFRTLASQK